jgi:hypothetical protein
MKRENREQGDGETGRRGAGKTDASESAYLRFGFRRRRGGGETGRPASARTRAAAERRPLWSPPSLRLPVSYENTTSSTRFHSHPHEDGARARGNAQRVSRCSYAWRPHPRPVPLAREGRKNLLSATPRLPVSPVSLFSVFSFRSRAAAAQSAPCSLVANVSRGTAGWRARKARRCRTALVAVSSACVAFIFERPIFARSAHLRLCA